MHPPSSQYSRPFGAARWFVEHYVGGPTREIESSIVLTPGVSTTVAISNPDRVGLVFVNNSASTILVVLSSEQSTGNNGIPVSAGGSIISMNVRDDFTLPAREWIAIGGAGIPVLYVLQIVSDIVTMEEPRP